MFVNYGSHVVSVIRSGVFDRWLRMLRDPQAKARINARILRLSFGNPGDAKPAGEGVSEMRIDYRPGYRVYFARRGALVILLLCGGDKTTPSGPGSWLGISRAKTLERKRSKTAWSRYDAADYLRSEKDIALYMDAVMAEAADDPALIAHALGDVARARRSMSQVARDVGVTREGLYKALSRDGNPSFATVARVAKALGLELHFRPIKKKAA